MNFKECLDTLRLSAKEAIIDGEGASLSDLKSYLHIKRPIENDLSHLILQAARSDESQLIFLLGNVGDGKSHLLARMWELHPEEMNVFQEVCNDATESTSIKISYLENLSRVFQPYSDEALAQGGVPVKTIIAINLGTLTNFLEEKEGTFDRLKSYVRVNHLVDENSEAKDISHIAHFNALNLTDYQIFSLSEHGAECQVMIDIIQKVTQRDTENPFFAAYQLYYDQHPNPDQCPVKFNFDLLQQPAVQRTISDLLIKVILSDKLIISVRLLMNLIYDLLVSPELANLSQDEMQERTASVNFKAEFYNHLLPVLLFESPTTSFILKSVRSY
jgi:DNA phosphorothioation-dependent restriction protein DptF